MRNGADVRHDIAWQHVFLSVPDALLICSLPSMEILQANDAAVRLLGEPSTDLSQRLQPSPDWNDDASPRLAWLTLNDGRTVGVRVRACRIPNVESMMGLLQIQVLRDGWLEQLLEKSQALLSVRDGTDRVLFATPRGKSISSSDEYEIQVGELLYQLERHEIEQIVLTLGVDVSKRKHAEEAEHQRADLFRLLLETTEDFVGIVDHQENRLYVNPAFYRATGYTPEEIQRTNFRTRIHPDDVTLVERTRQANLRGERTRIEYRCRCKNGSYVWLDLRATPIPDENGKIVRIVWSSRDVTDRKSVEYELRESRRLIEHIADTLPQTLFLYDLEENRYLWINARCVETHGYSPGEMLRMGPGEAVSRIHPEDRLQATEAADLMSRLGENEVLDIRYRVKHRTRGYLVIRTRCVVFRHREDGKPRQVLGVSELAEEPRDE